MIPTRRAMILLLLVAPIMGAATWSPGLAYIAWIYLVICLGLIILDWRLAGPVDRFQVERRMERRLSLGADNPVLILVRNRRQQAVQIWLRDEFPTEFEVDHLILEGRVEGRQTLELMYYVHPYRRGDYRFESTHLRWGGPLGLSVRAGSQASSEDVKVYPNLRDVRRYEVLLRQNRLEELGLRRSRRFGEGTEFERLREYQPDDSFRRINWKATARRHRPITVEYQTERSQTILPVLDVGRMMQSPVGRMAKLDYAVNAALMLAYVVTGRGDQCGLMTFADDVIHFIAPRAGRGQFYRLLESLYGIKAQPVEPDFSKALAYLASQQRKRALVVMFTDLSAGLDIQSLVIQLGVLARRCLPLVVTIRDPDLDQIAHHIPNTSLSTYQRAAALHLIDERRTALETLTRHGVHTLDVAADHLTIEVVNRYLELKGKMRL